MVKGEGRHKVVKSAVESMLLRILQHIMVVMTSLCLRQCNRDTFKGIGRLC